VRDDDMMDRLRGNGRELTAARAAAALDERRDGMHVRFRLAAHQPMLNAHRLVNRCRRLAGAWAR